MEFNYHNCGVGDALLQPMVVEALEDDEGVAHFPHALRFKTVE
jgi:hypothetical protein